MKFFLKRYFSTSTPTIYYPETEILRHCQSGSLSLAIDLLNSIPSLIISPKKPILYSFLLQACVKVHSFAHGLQIHSHVIKSGLETHRFVGNSLLSLYFKLGHDFDDTQKVFDGLSVKDVVSWTSMISGYVRIGQPMNAVRVFSEMLGVDVEPNGFTLSAVIKACSELGLISLGRCLHGMLIRCGFDSNHVISSALIDFYGKNYEPLDARQLFGELPEPDEICWTSLISAFTKSDMYEEALRLFYLKQRKCGFLENEFTLGPVLTACGNLRRLKQGKEIHAKVFTSGLCGNVVVDSSLVDMYAKWGSVAKSQYVFDRMPVKNLISWSALLGAYSQNEDHTSVIRIFREMKERDFLVFRTVLHACGGLAAVRLGKEVHCQYVRRASKSDAIVESALIDLYAKCGCTDIAYKIFVQMSVRDLITWNIMIHGFAQNGRSIEALRIFEDMIVDGTKPDYISFIGVLFACSHTGLVSEGRKYFALMTEEHGIKPGVEHYNCMVRLLSSAGFLEEAEILIKEADCRDDSSLWEVLLSACTNTAAAERIAKKMMELEPDHSLSYVLLAKLYSEMGRWDDSSKLRSLMKERGIRKPTGKSWIESQCDF